MSRAKMKIIFDFDHTLFRTKDFYRTLQTDFKKIGIDKKLFLQTYKETKIRHIVYKPFQQFRLIIKKNPGFTLKELKNLLENALNQVDRFLYPDVIPFLKKIHLIKPSFKTEKAGQCFNSNKNFDVDLFILSFGGDKFQKQKIKKSGIVDYFKKIILTTDITKIDGMKKILKKQERAIFIDDNLHSLLKIKKYFPNLIIVRINRTKRKCAQEPSNKEIDYCVKNLKEFNKILQIINKNKKALVLFSGGLDSILAVKILQAQNIKITGITFKSYFFNSNQAEKTAKNLRVKLKIVDISKEHLKIVKSPKYGYGKAMNPCIDCRILMLKKAKEYMKKEKFDFVATGEVLGQRPMTQNKKTLELIEKKSGLTGYLLRPLSAKLLKPTIPEKKGLINRKELLDISGRSRKRQIVLAKKWKIKEYPSPAGGCLLTDLEFGKRLKKLLKIYPQCQGNDIELLKTGRHFWDGKAKIIVGRDDKENKKIKKLARSKDILIEMKNYPGPLTLVRYYAKTKIPKTTLEKAKKLTQHYSTKARNKKNVEFKIYSK